MMPLIHFAIFAYFRLLRCRFSLIPLRHTPRYADIFAAMLMLAADYFHAILCASARARCVHCAAR
jgi:hypothetical protein